MKPSTAHFKHAAAVNLTIALLTVCMAHGSSWTKNTENAKGAIPAMKTHYVGRFSVTVPAVMNAEARLQKIRDVKMTEMIWPDAVSNEEARELEWKRFMEEIKRLRSRLTSDKVIIKTQDPSGIGKWAKGMYFHDQSDGENEGTWSVLMDAGPIGVWMKGRSVIIAEEKLHNTMFNNLCTLSQLYTSLDSTNKTGDWFYLKHGAIDLPYLWQESSYIRFEKHPLDLKIEIKMDMDEAYRREKHGLIEKANAAIDSGYAAMAQVQIKRIRSQRREVAGMPGEEVVDRLITKDKTELDFGWEYVGKNDSGEYPTVRITMESPDGNLDEKLRIWDAVLDSMKPMFIRKK